MLNVDEYYHTVEQLENDLYNTTPKDAIKLLKAIADLKDVCDNHIIDKCLNTLRVHTIYEQGVNTLQNFDD